MDTITISQSDAEWFEQSQRRAELISKYCHREISEAELKELNEWLDRHPNNRAWFNRFISQEFPTDEQIFSYARFDSEKALEELLRKIEG